LRILEIFCDGSGTTWDKAAGYGYVLVLDGEFLSEGSGHIPQGTNNDAEIAAAIKGMMAAEAILAKSKSDDEFFRGAPTLLGYTQYHVKLCSDSQLCLGWASGRYKHNDPNRSKTVSYLQKLFQELNVEPVWIKGHNGHEWNTRADALAYKGRTGEFKLKRDRVKASSES